MENNTALSAYDKVKLTRSSERATTADYIGKIIDDFTELHGDRRFGDDPAVIGGVGRICGMPVTVIGTEKGKSMQDRMTRHFGAASPEGYRKALRLVKQAEKFDRPVLFFVDIQGAACGRGAEERGVGQSIAEDLYEFGSVETPMLSVVIGEGGSGGALALSVADEIWMLENAYYSVIAPESCASILYKDPSRAGEVAESLRLTAHDLYELGVAERVIAEPNFAVADETEKFMTDLKGEIAQKLASLSKLGKKKLVKRRYDKFRKIGDYGLDLR